MDQITLLPLAPTTAATERSAVDGQHAAADGTADFATLLTEAAILEGAIVVDATVVLPDSAAVALREHTVAPTMAAPVPHEPPTTRSLEVLTDEASTTQPTEQATPETVIASTPIAAPALDAPLIATRAAATSIAATEDPRALSVGTSVATTDSGAVALPVAQTTGEQPTTQAPEATLGETVAVETHSNESTTPEAPRGETTFTETRATEIPRSERFDAAPLDPTARPIATPSISAAPSPAQGATRDAADTVTRAPGIERDAVVPATPHQTLVADRPSITEPRPITSPLAGTIAAGAEPVAPAEIATARVVHAPLPHTPVSGSTGSAASEATPPSAQPATAPAPATIAAPEVADAPTEHGGAQRTPRPESPISVDPRRPADPPRRVAPIVGRPVPIVGRPAPIIGRPVTPPAPLRSAPRAIEPTAIEPATRPDAAPQPLLPASAALPLLSTVAPSGPTVEVRVASPEATARTLEAVVTAVRDLSTPERPSIEAIVRDAEMGTLTIRASVERGTVRAEVIVADAGHARSIAEAARERATTDVAFAAISVDVRTGNGRYREEREADTVEGPAPISARSSTPVTPRAVETIDGRLDLYA